jgi:hypothetical protein
MLYGIVHYSTALLCCTKFKLICAACATGWTYLRATLRDYARTFQQHHKRWHGRAMATLAL